MRNFESGKDYLSFLLRDTVNLNTERGITMADGDRFDQSPDSQPSRLSGNGVVPRLPSNRSPVL
jgi:hypothetical protein